MREDVAFDPVAEGAIVRNRGAETGVIACKPFVLRRHEKRREAGDLLVGNRRRAAPETLPVGLDVSSEDLGRHVLDQDLDPRLVLVVSPAEAVVHAQDRIEVIEDFLARQEFTYDVTDHRCAAEASADQHAEADFTRGLLDGVHADVVDQRRRAIGRRSAHRDLELARQVRELRVERRPLAEQLAIGPGIDDFVGGYAGKVVARDVAHAVAAGLDRVHLDRGQLGQDIGHIFESRPVELDVLARGEVTVASVILASDVRELAQLGR